MPGPRPRSFMKPKKGTVKRLMKSLWKNYKFGLIISFVSLTLSIVVNLCGSIFASLITEVLTKAIGSGENAFTGWFEVSLLNLITFKANLTTLITALAIIYGVGVICSWAWTRTMAVVAQNILIFSALRCFLICKSSQSNILILTKMVKSCLYTPTTLILLDNSSHKRYQICLPQA